MTTIKLQRTAVRILVVLDHQEAKIYRTETPESSGERITPYDPHGYGRHLHSAHEWTDGKRCQERKKYYEAIAKTLKEADEIILFGNGEGRSSAMEQLLSDLKSHHADVASKVIGTINIDAGHVTENQLLARSRELFSSSERSNGQIHSNS